MRICILTQPLHTNYGGLLQAYALQQILRDMGHEVWTEDRLVDKFSPLRSLFRSAFIRQLFGWPRYLSSSEIAVIREHTSRFIDENIRCTVPVYGTCKKALEQYEFDCYIVGSDQVWRADYSAGIENYFLDFAADSAIKIAYAASFGVDHWQWDARKTKHLSHLAQRFDLVSVREQQGVVLCRQFLGVDARRVLDPTMLLSADHYNRLMESAPKRGGAVSYLLDSDAQMCSAVESLAGDMQLEMSDIAHHVDNNYYDGRPASSRVVPAVAEWLSALRDAECVVTDSFHGAVFSILFKKPFVLLTNSKRGDSRHITLLNLFGLQSRLITRADELTRELMVNPIDYAAVESALERYKEESLQLLGEALNR